MSEFRPIWKEHNFSDRFTTSIPEGKSKASGPCLRVALFQAGIDTDLSSWVSRKHLPEICTKLGLNLVMDRGEEVFLPDGEPYIIGYEIYGTPKETIGHYIFTTQISEILGQIDGKDIFAIIEILHNLPVSV